MRILVTGAAGFIGFHLSKFLLNRGDTVIGLDNINSYYSVNLKYLRLEKLGIIKDDIIENDIIESSNNKNFYFIKTSLENKEVLESIFKKFKIDKICNLAAQAGVRYSLINPDTYISSNIVGYLNILELSRHYKIKHLVYASSSSVYGNSKDMPLSTDDPVNNPISLYAATKKSNELMSHTYSHLFSLPTTGLRFFTVYGPWGRPDMALFLFTKAIIEEKPIDVYNHGNMIRDFTYIDDIVEGIIRVIDNPPKNKIPYKIYNIGNSSPVKLTDFILEIEKNLNKVAEKNFLPIQPGDVPMTFADVKNLENDLNYKPKTTIKYGIKKFIDWYLKFKMNEL